MHMHLGSCLLTAFLDIYHMDVDSDFLELSHESMEVNSAQLNIVAGPSWITVLLPNKNLHKMS